jgi:hypothetical protein
MLIGEWRLELVRCQLLVVSCQLLVVLQKMVKIRLTAKISMILDCGV